jgi:hypothetical protein
VSWKVVGSDPGTFAAGGLSSVRLTLAGSVASCIDDLTGLGLSPAQLGCSGLATPW